MGKCPNCGQKTKGDACQWCDYPLRKRGWLGRKNGQSHLRKLIKQSAKGEPKIEQIIKEASKIIKKEADEESAKIVAEELAKAIEEQAKKEAREKARREAEQIIREFMPKAPEIIEKEPPVVTTDLEETEEQTTQPELSPPAHQEEVIDSHFEIEETAEIAGKIKVIIIDRQIIFYEGLHRYFSRTPDIAVIGNSHDFNKDTITTMIEKMESGVVIIDANPPSLSGIDLARDITGRFPTIPIIILTPYENDDQTLKAIKAGVAGYLGKDITPDELANAIRSVFQRERIIIDVLTKPRIARRVLDHFQDTMKVTREPVTSLSPEKMEILEYFAKGHSSKQVSHIMALSDETIKDALVSVVAQLIANPDYIRSDEEVDAR